jgi:hypothetical protein
MIIIFSPDLCLKMVAGEEEGAQDSRKVFLVCPKDCSSEEEEDFVNVVGYFAVGFAELVV